MTPVIERSRNESFEQVSWKIRDFAWKKKIEERRSNSMKDRRFMISGKNGGSVRRKDR